MKIQDTVRAAVDEARFARVLDTMRKSTEAKLDTTDLQILRHIGGVKTGVHGGGKGKGLVLHHRGDILLANAVTRYSQDVEDYDRASKLEAIGYNVMTMSPAMFRQINQAGCCRRTRCPPASRRWRSGCRG